MFNFAVVEGDCMILGSLLRRCLIGVAGLIIMACGGLSACWAANTWDAGDGTQWWFDPVNWSANTALPPSDGAATPAFTDGQINIGTAGLPGGEGVVYDPVNDPNFAAAAALTYPTGSTLLTSTLARDYGPQTLYRFYVSRNTTNTNLLTIKSGDLAVESTTIIGRSGSTGTGAGQQNLGEVVQTGGTVRFPLIGVDLGQREASGWGNGTWDYRGGTLEVAEETGGTPALRLSQGSTTAGFGAGGQGRFIMHNPASGGHVLALNVQSASYAGSGTDGVFDSLDPDGITTGVATFEYHFENGGTRPMQVISSLSINNGFMSTTGGTRSSRLDLRLDSAPTVAGGIPQNLGLFDVDSDNNATGTVQGLGTLGGTFSNADGTVNYPAGATVSAVFGSTQYNWTIGYTGNITWTDQANSVVNTIAGTGGVDVVLMGLSTQPFTPPGVPGDYNNNGIVDAADYSIWRHDLGQSVTIPNDPTPGTVTQSDYDFWKAHFGATSGAGAGLSAGGAVPEPSSLKLALVGMIGFGVCRRRTA